MEGWFALSIYLSAAVLLLSLLVCLPNLISSTRGWLFPDSPAYGFASAPRAQQASFLVFFAETLTVISGAYLTLALFIKSSTR